MSDTMSPATGRISQPLFRNHYYCEPCDTAWEMIGHNTCNDRCPTYDAEVEPDEVHDYLPHSDVAGGS